MRHDDGVIPVVAGGGRRIAATATGHVVVELGETNLWVSPAWSSDAEGHGPNGPDGPAAALDRPGREPAVDAQRVPATLVLAADGALTTRSAAGPADPTATTVSGFLARVDDGIPIVLGDLDVPAAQLVAEQVAALVGDRVEGGHPATRVTLVHPGSLSTLGRRDVERRLRPLLDRDVTVTWCSRARAAAAVTPEVLDLLPDQAVAVLHVGGATAEASVWVGSPDHGGVGPALVDRGCAGRAVDDAVASLLTSSAAGTGGAVPPGMRVRAAAAKERLSSETAVDVPLPVADGRRAVRVVRSELDEATVGLRRRQLDLVEAALTRRGLDTSALGLLLLVGGGAAAPGLVEAASTRFGVPTLSVPRLGAALLAAPGALDAHPVAESGTFSAPALAPPEPHPASSAAEPRHEPSRPAAVPAPSPRRGRERPGRRSVVVPVAAWAAATASAASAASRGSTARVREVHLRRTLPVAGVAAGLVVMGFAAPGALDQARQLGIVPQLVGGALGSVSGGSVDAAGASGRGGGRPGAFSIDAEGNAEVARPLRDLLSALTQPGGGAALTNLGPTTLASAVQAVQAAGATDETARAARSAAASAEAQTPATPGAPASSAGGAASPSSPGPTTGGAQISPGAAPAANPGTTPPASGGSGGLAGGASDPTTGSSPGDPTPDPVDTTAPPSPDPTTPGPTVAPDPTQDPTSDPTPEQTPDPTLDPTPDPTPAVTPTDPTPTPVDTGSADGGSTGATGPTLDGGGTAAGS